MFMRHRFALIWDTLAHPMWYMHRVPLGAMVVLPTLAQVRKNEGGPP